MFNSQKINNDPEPYEVVENGVRIAVGGYWESGSAGELTKYKPRPEFDNNPNPILVAVRQVIRHHGMDGEEAANLARNWLKRERYYESNLGLLPRKSHREHARKVLERIVNVYG